MRLMCSTSCKADPATLVADPFAQPINQLIGNHAAALGKRTKTERPRRPGTLTHRPGGLP